VADVEIVLDLDGKLYDKKISKKEAEAIVKGKKIGGNLGGNIAKESANKFSSLATGFFTAAFTKVFDGIFRLVGNLGGQVSNAIAASIEQADALNQLNTALALAGDFSQAASKDLQDFAIQLQKTTVISDETTLQMLALSKSFGVSNKQAKELVTAAANLSAVTGKDLRTSVEQLGGSLSGNLGLLGRTAPALRGLSKEALAAGGAIQFVNERFGGAAEAQAQTFSGAITQLKNQFGDLLEVVGDIVTKSPVLVEVFKFISEQISRAGQSLTDFQQSGDVFGELIVKAVQFGQVVNKFVVVPVELAANAVTLAFNAILVVFQTTINKIAEAALFVVSTFSPNGALTQSLKQFTENGAVILGDFTNATKAAFEGLADSSTADGIASFLEELEARTTAALGRQVAATQQMTNNTKAALKEAGNEFEAFKGLVDNVVNGLISASLANLGAALVGSGGGFKAFAKQAAGILGDFFIQMGTTIIAADTAIIALKASLLAFGGGLGIAAGAGLIIAGGALKALSGGPSAVAGVGTVPPVAAPSIGGGAGGIDSPGDLATLADPERAEPQTNVTVNVSGVVTDPRGTAKQIGDLLKDGFKTNGLNIARATV